MKTLAIRLVFGFAIASFGFAHAQSGMICRLATGVKATDIARKYGVSLTDYTANGPFALFGGARDSIVSKMRRDPSIVWIENDSQVGQPEDEAQGKPSKGGGLPAVGDRTGLQTINKNILSQINWNANLAYSSGRAVHIAILDTGISPKQSALWSKVDASMNAVEPGQPAYDIPHRTDSNQNGVPDEAVGHGTMVAGIVDQIAPGVRFVVGRITDSDGIATGWNLIKGLAFAVSSKAEVVNVSLGSLNEVPALEDVMQWCIDSGVLVVAPIGNNGMHTACYPAKIEEVVCVGGLDKNNAKASFSNWDSICALSAPAVGFASQFWDGQLAVWSGTSFASPVVAASIADALRHTTKSSPEVLRHALISTGLSLSKSDPHYASGLGVLVNYKRLVTSISTATADPELRPMR